MKPLNPRSWFDRRLIVGSIGLLLVALILSVALRSAVYGAMIVFIWCLTDFLFVTIRDRRRKPDVSLKMVIIPIAGQDAALAGAQVRLAVTITTGHRLHDILIAPVQPQGVTAMNPGAYGGRLDAGKTARFFFDLRMDRAGNYVFPGVVIHFGSPLGLFSSAMMLCDRQAVAVLPDSIAGTGALHTVFSKRSLISTSARRHVMRGCGSDFRELREYQPEDTSRRVDWKATARRGQLMVREYEEPREFTIQIILDASIDMAMGTAAPEGFANAADLIARLAFLARAEDIALRLWMYDEYTARKTNMGHGSSALVRLITQVIDLPRQALMARIENGTEATLHEMTQSVWKKTQRMWNETAIHDAALTYIPDPMSPLQKTAHLLAELAPDVVLKTPTRCRQCDAPVHADEARCVKCGHTVADGSLPPRAARAVESLAKAMKQARGREMLIVISALCGGEASSEVAAYLTLAAAGHRTVHLACPGLVARRRPRVAEIGNLGNYPTRRQAMRHLHRLHRAAGHHAFAHRLTAAGVRIHDLADRSDLEQILSDILLTEVLAASA